MPDHHDASYKFDQLRQRADNLIEQQPDLAPDASSDILELIHELRIHQAELEIQNEELKRAQQELMELHHKFENLYEFAPCGYITLNNKGIITRINLFGTRLLGVNRKVSHYSGFSQFIASDWQHSYLSAQTKSAETGQKQIIELPLNKGKGATLWVRADIEADRDETGAVFQWRMVLVDITKKKVAETNLFQKTKVLDGINRMFGEALGGGSEKALKENCLTIIEEVTASKLSLMVELGVDGLPRDVSVVEHGWESIGSLDQGIRRRLPSDFHLQGVCGQVLKKGKSVYANEPERIGLPASPLPLTAFLGVPLIQDDHVLGMIAVGNRNGGYRLEEQETLESMAPAIVSILMRKRAETIRKRLDKERLSLEKRRHQLEKARSLSRMAGAVAHHFNNMLAAVMGNLELAIMELPLEASPSGNLSNAMIAARRASDLSRLMLAYVGQSSTRRERLYLSETFELHLSTLRDDLPETLSLDANLTSPGPLVRGNPDQIQQILECLINNAREAIGEHQGLISLDVKTVTSADIPTFRRFPVDWQPRDADYACLKIADTGGGIEDKDIGKIFDPFFSTKFTGRGLGLPVAQGALKTHRGCITVDNAPGRGCTFSVFLPILAGDIQRPKDNIPRASDMLAGGLVLLIDDQAMIRNVVKSMLEKIGFEVLVAKDGVEGVEIFRENQPNVDVVISDLTMPRMNGWETMAALRAIWSDIPVVLSSAYDESQAMVGHQSEPEPQAFLRKPYHMEMLKATLVKVMQVGNSTQDSQATREKSQRVKIHKQE